MGTTERAQLKQFRQSLSYARTFENTMDFQPTGEKKWVVKEGSPWPKACCDGDYPYVVMSDGELRFSQKPWPVARIRHPELCGGKEVIGAGLFRLQKGKIVFLSNESGHYSPDSDSLYYVRRAFLFWAAPLADNAVVDGSWEVFGNS